MRVTLIRLYSPVRRGGLRAGGGTARLRPSACGVSVAPKVFTNEEDEVTKSELVDQVADRADLTKQDAARAVDAVLATVEDALRRGSEVTVSGFGKFHVGERGARQGVNPRTGERIQIAASRVPRFTAGSGLKSAVKGR
jgi:DNA-binding protein HU-beta